MFHMQGLGALLQGVSFRTSPSVLAGWSRWQPLSSWPWWSPWPGGWQNHKCHLKIFLVAKFCFLFQYKFTFQNISFFYRFIVSVSLRSLYILIKMKDLILDVEFLLLVSCIPLT